ncbi:MAG: hypothetical protein Q7R70_05110 [Candidatus Diapherotrites archaeon]|nr:hypothetical protein [Candidatus Diapherotrites archaeon]
MVRLESELWKFSELCETHSIEKTNDLLSEGWVLIEAHARDGKKTFLLGKEKIHQAAKLDLDKEIEAVLEKHGKKYENLDFNESKEAMEVNSSTIKSLIKGPVFLGLGIYIFFQSAQKSLLLLGSESTLLQNVLFFAGVVLTLVGLMNVLGFIAKKEGGKNE